MLSLKYMMRLEELFYFGYNKAGRDAEYLIGWKCIRQIGADIILVDVDLEKCMQKPTN